MRVITEKRKGEKVIQGLFSFLLLYILWTVETVFPFWFPELSLIFLVVAALSFSPPLATFLGFFLGFLTDNLSPTLLGRYALLFSLIAFLLSYFKRYLIFSYPYLFSLVLLSLLLKGLVGGFNLLKFFLTLLSVIPTISLLRKWGKGIFLNR
ncbi:MAG: rod shape-determining protein MreD [candidate division WOR-3 bacterium]